MRPSRTPEGISFKAVSIAFFAIPIRVSEPAGVRIEPDASKMKSTLASASAGPVTDHAATDNTVTPTQRMKDVRIGIAPGKIQHQCGPSRPFRQNGFPKVASQFRAKEPIP